MSPAITTPVHKNVCMRRLSAGGRETLKFLIIYYAYVSEQYNILKLRLCSHRGKRNGHVWKLCFHFYSALLQKKNIMRTGLIPLSIDMCSHTISFSILCKTRDPTGDFLIIPCTTVEETPTSQLKLSDSPIKTNQV